MTDIINHPAHYTGVTAEIECIDIARHLNFQLGNAFKNIWRAGKKAAGERKSKTSKKRSGILRIPSKTAITILISATISRPDSPQL